MPLPFTFRPLALTCTGALVSASIVGTARAQERAVPPPPGTAASQPASRPAGRAVSAAVATTRAVAATVTPFRAGDRTFIGTPAGALYATGTDGQFHLVLPAAAVPYVAISPSPDGRYVAFGLAAPGSDAHTYDVHVRDLSSGQDLPEVLHHAAINFKAWTHDNRGFFYTRADSATARQRVYYHRLRTAQTADRLVLSQYDHPEFGYDAQVSDDGQYAVFTISHSQDAKTALSFIDLSDPGKPKLDAPVVHLVSRFGARYQFVDDAGSYFFLQTDRAAPRGQIVLADIDVTRESWWPPVVSEQTDSLEMARTAGDQFLLAVYRTPHGDQIRVFGPPNPRAVRDEMRHRLDSLRRARKDRPEGSPEPISAPMLGRPVVRLQPRNTVALPPGATVLDIRTVADHDDLYYTLRLPDGTVHTYRYNVKKEIAGVLSPPAAPPPAPASGAPARPPR